MKNFAILAVIANSDDFLYKTILEKNSKEFIKEKYNEKDHCEPEEEDEEGRLSKEIESEL